jgi:hypothetical protein
VPQVVESEINNTSFFQGSLEGTANPFQWLAFVCKDVSCTETAHLRQPL